MYWGIDGCKRGWIAIGLTTDFQIEYGVFSKLENFWNVYHDNIDCILLDMPIGLPSNKSRTVESQARQLIRPNQSSVFSVPTRKALEFAAQLDFAGDAFKKVCDFNESLIGKRFSKQSWGIMSKIYEVDIFLKCTPAAHPVLYESHPEVLFWALNGQKPLQYPKKQGLGFYERLQILQKYYPDTLEFIRSVYDKHQKKLNDDDVVDALVCAISGLLGNLQSLPTSMETDSTGLPMRMVYPGL